MSIELEVQERKTELTPHEALEKELREHFEADLLDLGDIDEIPRPHNPDQTMGSAPGEPWGVNQELRAVVKAGKDYYFLIDASARVRSSWTAHAESINGTFVAKFRPGNTARLVDFSVERDFEHATIRPLYTRIKHPGVDITVAMDSEGVVGVVDEGSKQWVEVFRQKPQTEIEATPEDPDQPDGPASLRINSGSAWFLQSSQVMDAMEHTLGRY